MVKKKVLYTVIAAILLVLLYVIIFLLSAEDQEQSSVASEKITEILFKIYYFFVGEPEWSGEIVIAPEHPAESIVRKLAHFTEYGCVGFLSYSIVVMWYQPVWKGRLLVVIQLLLSGALDEFHQYFVPGRHATVRDVLIDTAGGIAGMLLIVLWMKRQKRKNKEIPLPAK